MLSGRHKAVFVLGLMIGAVFLWIAVRNVDLASLQNALATANFLFAIPFLLTFGLFYWLKATRWAYLLQPIRSFTNKELFAPMIIGFAGNNVLPVRLGELLRIYLLAREFGISKTLILGTLILERVFDAICILVLLMVAMLTSQIESNDLSAARIFLGTATAVSLVSIYVVVKPPDWLCRVISTVSNLVPGSIIRGLDNKIQQIRQGFSAITSIRKATLIAVNSLIQWLLLAACIHISISALGIQAPVSASIIVLGLVVAGISIPTAPGFVGTVELCFVIGLGFFDVNATEALAAAIYYHVLAFASVTGTGALLLRRYHSSLSELRQDAESSTMTDR